MAIEALYPPAPANVPAEITRPDRAYRLRVLAMIGGLFLFLILYLLLIAIFGLIAYWLLLLPLPTSGGRGIVVILVFKLGGALAAVLLCLFLFKGLFKGQRVDRSTYLQLQEKDHPELFSFIRRVYQDTGAPRPRRVYVSPDVNAALVYDSSLLNMFYPPRKDLLIGLGLVNVVTLSEFKAVMAHEFGHFAQRSVGLGSYLYVANRVMHDVIYSRDGLDGFVDVWSQQDIRISFPAWGLKGVLWVVRHILAGAYQGLNLLHLSLSRQLEFNADNVAVSVTGSDALVHGLARLQFATECMADVAQSLNAAADHGIFTDDLFYHQTQAASWLRTLTKNERAGLPPDLPTDHKEVVQVFQSVDDGIPDRYRSHPTDYMREQNAKRIYVRSPRDDRSPWLLFGSATELKAAVTRQFYRHMIDRHEQYDAKPAPEVQAFIDAEHEEIGHFPKYNGLFDERYINPGDLDALPDQPWPREEITSWLAGWPPPEVRQQIEAHHQRQSEYQLLRGLKSGELTIRGKTFTLRDQKCSINDVNRLFLMVDKELDSDIQAFQRLDRQVLLAHWSLARHLDGGASVENQRQSDLLGRYRFHMAVLGLLQGALSDQAHLHVILDALSKNSELSQDSYHRICTTLDGIRQALDVTLDNSKALLSPALTNVPAGTCLFSLIIDRGDTELSKLFEGSLSGEWLHRLLTRLDGVISRLRRVHAKSLGSLVAYLEKLEGEWNRATVDQRVEPQVEVSPSFSAPSHHV